LPPSRVRCRPAGPVRAPAVAWRVARIAHAWARYPGGSAALRMQEGPGWSSVALRRPAANAQPDALVASSGSDGCSRSMSPHAQMRPLTACNVCGATAACKSGVGHVGVGQGLPCHWSAACRCTRRRTGARFRYSDGTPRCQRHAVRRPLQSPVAAPQAPQQLTAPPRPCPVSVSRVQERSDLPPGRFASTVHGTP